MPVALAKIGRELEEHDMESRRRVSAARNEERIGSSRELAACVARYLERKQPGLSARQKSRLARHFIEAGIAAFHTERGTIHESAAAMSFHRRMLSASRLRLAQCSPSHDQASLQSKRDKRIHDTLLQNWSRLSKYPNVVGYAVGNRTIAGIRTGERCASVLVSKKMPLKDFTRRKRDVLPRDLRGGDLVIPVDVMEVGDFQLYSNPSAKIAPQTSPNRTATLGIFATDNTTAAPLALTAMHAAGDLQEYPPAGGPGDPINFVMESDQGSSLLGALLRGTRNNGIDAAAIQLSDGQQPSRMVPGVGEVSYWRVLDNEADVGTGVTMCGAETGIPVHGVIANPCVYVPQYNLGPAIQVTIAAQPGDSGAPLVDRDTFLLGLLVGGGQTTQFFSPIGNIFNQLSCALY